MAVQRSKSPSSGPRSLDQPSHLHSDAVPSPVVDSSRPPGSGAGNVSPQSPQGRVGMPAGKLIPVRFGDVDVYVETMPPSPCRRLRADRLRPPAPARRRGRRQSRRRLRPGPGHHPEHRHHHRLGPREGRQGHGAPRDPGGGVGIASSAEGHIVVAKATAEASLTRTFHQADDASRMASLGAVGAWSGLIGGRCNRRLGLLGVPGRPGGRHSGASGHGSDSGAR